MTLSLLYFLFGFAVSFLMVPVVIRISRLGIGLDVSNENRKRHEGDIPRIGGLPIIITLMLGLVGILYFQGMKFNNWAPILVGSLLMFGLGFWDDLKPLGAKKKLLGQIMIALLVHFMGLGIDKMTYPGMLWTVELGAWSLVVTVFWLIAVPNIVNLIDGFDGLAGGLGLFMALTLGIVGLASEQYSVAHYAFVMAGALLGFLCFNFPPAKIFLGDGGAYLIGFSIAALSMTSSHKGSIAAVLLVTVVGLGVPILDTTFALMRRAFRGLPLFRADDEHVHHRLEDLGFSKRGIVLGIYGICVVLSVIGLSIFWSQGRTIPIAIGAIFLLVVFSLRYLQNIRNLEDAKTQMERALGQRRMVQYALLQAQVMELELERCEDGEEFWSVFNSTMERVGFMTDKDGSRDECIAVEIKYNGDKPWVLFAPIGSGTPFELQRLAECFRPVYTKAVIKWRPQVTNLDS